MKFLIHRRILDLAFAIIITGSLLLSACGPVATPAPSLPGTPVVTPSSRITNENVDLLTELAHWRVDGWVKHCLAFSPDNRLLALVIEESGIDGVIQLMDSASGFIVRTLTGLPENSRVESLTFSPDGKTLAASSFDKTVKIWNVETGKELRTFTFPDAAYGVTFSPDGKIIAVGVRDGTTQLLHADSGEVLHILTGHTDLVQSVNFSADGLRLVTGSFDGTVKLWDVKSGEEIQTLKGHKGTVWKVSFSPDGKTLASASADATVRLWDAATGQEIFVMKDKDQFFAWYDVAFSMDGKVLAAASTYTLTIWDTASGNQLRTIDIHDLDGGNDSFSNDGGIDVLSFSPDGKLLATGGDGIVRIWGVP